MTKRFGGMTFAAVTATVFLTGASFGARPDRPPTPFHGAWSYSNSASHDGSSSSESLSVSENGKSENGKAGSGFADITVEEMVNGTTRTCHQSHVAYKNVNVVLEKLITQAKYQAKK